MKKRWKDRAISFREGLNRREQSECRGKTMVEGSCFSPLLFKFSHKTRKKGNCFGLLSQ